MSKLRDAQTRLVGLIAADPFFTDPDATKVVPVIGPRVGNIPDALNKALQKASIGVVIMTSDVSFSENSAPPLDVSPRFVITVTENPLMNKTGKTAEDAMERIMQLVHFAPADAVGYVSRFVLEQKAAQLVEPPAHAPMLLSFIIFVSAQLNLNP